MILNRLLAGPDAKPAFCSNGLLDQLKKALAERALNVEMNRHLTGERCEGAEAKINGRPENQAERVEIDNPLMGG